MHFAVPSPPDQSYSGARLEPNSSSQRYVRKAVIYHKSDGQPTFSQDVQIFSLPSPLFDCPPDIFRVFVLLCTVQRVVPRFERSDDGLEGVLLVVRGA